MIVSTTPVSAWRKVLFALFASLFCSAAVAQWQWVDGTGRKVFSDTPPPPSIPEKDILKRAGSSNQAPVTAAPAVSPVAPVAAPLISGRDETLEAKKRETEAKEQAQKKAEAEQFAKVRQDNCERAKRSQATLESGVRIATTNAKGEREIMNDAARSAELKRTNEVIQSSCGASAP